MGQDNTTSLLLAFEDNSLGTLYCEYFQRLEFNATLVEGTSSTDSMDILTQRKYDAMVVCLSSDNKKELAMVKDLRDYTQLPLFVILPENEKEDIIEAYNIGADDVLVKPASPEILACKINALLRRLSVEGNMQAIFELGNITFDVERQVLIQNGEVMQRLSGKETELLQLLASNENKILERSFILRKIWKADNYFNGRSLSVYINHLRNILKDVEDIRIISIHGKGYKLVKNA